MSVYILVEGRRTEPKIYPSWLNFLLPGYTRAKSVDKTDEYSYYLVAGYGYPRIKKRIVHSLQDIEKYPSYKEFVVILDSEDNEVTKTRKEINDIIQREKKEKKIFNLSTNVIIQKRSIETWLLGNRNIFQENPEDDELKKYIDYFDVRQNNPELLGKYNEKYTHAQFHNKYLKLLLREKNIRYTKKFPRDTKELYYLKEILNRVEEEPTHLKTFQRMVECFSKITSPTF